MQQRRGNNKVGWFRGLTRAATIFFVLMLALQAIWTYNMVRRPRPRGWDMNNRATPYYAPRRTMPSRESEVATEKHTGSEVISVETALSKVRPATQRDD
jgi:hypothetical protein